MDKLDEAIKKHTPVFAIWDRPPTSVNEYLENSVIFDNGNDLPYSKRRMTAGSYSAESFVKLMGGGGSTSTVYYDFFKTGGVIRITYFMFYPINDGYLWGKIGFHYGDWEHVSVDLSGENFEPLRMYFAAHGSTEGRWLPWGDVEKYNETARPIVYISARSNASYPRARFYPRMFFVANDKTRGDNLVAGAELRWIQAEPWFNYRGKMGSNREQTRGEIRNVKHSWWYRNESKISTNTFKQLFVVGIHKILK